MNIENIPLSEALGRSRRGFAAVAAMSFAVNLLMLTGSIYMLQVYDRVLTGRSLYTLAFLMLIPLAFTSFDIWKKRLGKNWKRLHQFIYLIAPLAALHYAWGKKGDFFQLRGDIIRPLIYSLIIIIFLITRIPQVRKALASFRDRVLIPFRRRGPEPKANIT